MVVEAIIKGYVIGLGINLGTLMYSDGPKIFSSDFPIERVGEDPDIEGETSRLAMTSSPGSANPWPESPTNVTNDQ